ncbi:Histone-arginine methyltransferase carm1 [Phlyctochytrium bullatum]|nr:Histone-arginine methyltransferase carm1 [Phlyctochytrium bullatum]
MEMGEGGKGADEAPNSDGRDPAYFNYYAQFVHQQNMLQDNVRTSTYHTAILGNTAKLFQGKTVMDIGAGSGGVLGFRGILSYFAVQAGASKVYAVEASGMALKIKRMMANSHLKNTWMQGKLEVIQSKVEEVRNIPKVDTLISEPIGVLLVHERMIESYLYARDNFLKPGGAMVPSAGTIYLSPFSDANVWTQTMAKVRFWEQPNFFGVDFSPLAKSAKEEIFAQPVVGAFDHRLLMAPSCKHDVDFETISIGDLQDITINIEWICFYTGIMHGIGGWFDINLGGFNLSTAPNAEKTHWQQVRFLLREPLAVNAFEKVRGWMRLKVNAMRSYDVAVELVVGDQIEPSDPKDAVFGYQYAEPGVDDPAASALKNQPMEFPRRRKAYWALQDQTYWYGGDQVAPELDKPEYFSLYPTE